MNESADTIHIADLQWEKEKQIIMQLMRGVQLKLIAEQYGTNPKEIHRLREKLINNFGYIRNQLPPEIQEYLKSWAKKHKRTISDEVTKEAIIKKELDSHKDDLYQAAKDIIRKLPTYTDWECDDSSILEINVERNDLDAIDMFQSRLAIDLFLHLRNDILELQRYSRWEDIKVGEITQKLLDLISAKAAIRDFKGKCDIYPYRN